MTLSSEQRIRALFPVIRLMQGYIPLRVTGWLNRQGARHARLPAGVDRTDMFADSVSCIWLNPKNSARDQVLLYLHGGGFVYGVTPLHLEMVAYLAQKMRMAALMVDYRLAPDHPFPAALDDCVTVYRWLLRQSFAASNLVVAGDSAGGNLTITTLMKLRDSGEPLPAAAACLSPAPDLSTRAYPSNTIHDPLLTRRAMKLYNTSYVAHNDAHDPLISPVYGDWHDLPPMLVHAGEDEILCHDAVRIAELAGAAGVDVRLEVYPRMWHVWQLYPTLPQARQSLDDIAQFLKSHIGAPP